MRCRYSNLGVYVGIEIECKGVCKEMENDIRCCVDCPKKCEFICEIAKIILRIEANDEKSN